MVIIDLLVNIKINFYAIDTPINFPIPKVIAAANNPKSICLNPEYHTFLPVNNVMAAPIINSPNADNPTLIYTAFIPFININGNTGNTAPIANRINE